MLDQEIRIRNRNRKIKTLNQMFNSKNKSPEDVIKLSNMIGQEISSNMRDFKNALG